MIPYRFDSKFGNCKLPQIVQAHFSVGYAFGELIDRLLYEWVLIQLTVCPLERSLRALEAVKVSILGVDIE